MQLFYGHTDGSVAYLTEEESRHAIKVLRKKSGDEIHVMDGRGSLYTGTIVNEHPKRCSVSIHSKEDHWGAVPYQFHLAIAPTKSIDRMEWLLEKAVEIGISEITPLLCEHSERKIIKPERLEKILLSACKQSLKGTVPRLNPLTPFNEFIQREHPTPCYIGYCGNEEKSFLPDLLKSNGVNACVMIGPEGDFSPSEFEKARDEQIQAISLGEQRMRTETAGLAAIHSAHVIHELFFRNR